MSCFKLLEAERASFSVPLMCRLLGVSRSGYYAWRYRPPSRRDRADADLITQIEAIHEHSKGTYGPPRVHAELRLGEARRGRPLFSQERVARLMRKAGLRGCCRGRGTRTTTRRAGRTPFVSDLVERDFAPEAPDRLWVADITYFSSWEGWMYLAFVIHPPKRNSRSQSWPKRLRRWVAGIRQIVETVYDKLLNAFGLHRERPHEMSGVRARLAARVTLHNFCIWLNDRLGRPWLAFADLLAW